MRVVLPAPLAPVRTVSLGCIWISTVSNCRHWATFSEENWGGLG